VPHYRRPLAELLNSLADAGFTLEKIIEPLPTEEFKLADPTGYAKLLISPAFIIHHFFSVT
jgi:hypothetical protein